MRVRTHAFKTSFSAKATVQAVSTKTESMYWHIDMKSSAMRKAGATRSGLDPSIELRHADRTSFKCVPSHTQELHVEYDQLPSLPIYEDSTGPQSREIKGERKK